VSLPHRAIHSRRGSALVEFAIVLPFLLLIFLGLADACLLLDDQLSLVHLSREAASVLSRGADFRQTFDAITRADGLLDLDGTEGLIILTRIALDKSGTPIIVQQERRGDLDAASVIGTMSAGTTCVPATIPNNRTMPNNMSLIVVELFSQQHHFLGSTGFAPGNGTIVLTTLAAF